jgi:hypothetical protein
MIAGQSVPVNVCPVPPVTAVTGPKSAAGAVAECLGERSFSWADERELQDAVDVALSSSFTTWRERALSRTERPDFLVDVDGFTVAVEVKVAGAHTQVLRQLGRYAAHVGVDAVLLASGRRTLLAGIPTVIHQTPIAVVLLRGMI